MSFLARVKKKCRRALEWVKLQRESALDAHRYFRSASWAGPVKRHELAHIESDLIKHYHVLEKGLAMADFRPRAGTEVLKRLIVLTSIWKDAGGDEKEFHFQAALAVIKSYVLKHRALDLDVSDLVPPGFFESYLHVDSKAGAKLPNEILADDLTKFDQIALSRHSVRQFNLARAPEHELLTAAVEIAISAPSVCNRQTWRVHFFEGEAAQKILAFQNGNRGFGHLIPTVAIVTSDLRLFAGGAERYQGWVEGGLFSMNFLLALHARGLSSVALNWSRSNRDDRLLRAAGEIPGHERIIMLIGCGYASEDHEVTCSPRSPVAHFIKWH
ncbi:nitroreductase family protein [Verrucomicrobiaceae bacterium 227]